MILKVIKDVDHPHNYHTCEDESGRLHRVDLLVNGDLPEETTPEDLVGKTVTVDYLAPYITIAYGWHGINPGW